MNFQILREKGKELEEDNRIKFPKEEVKYPESITSEFPLISIVIPLYNEENSIKDILRRIPNHFRFEIIITDDGSTDNSVKCVKEVCHEIKNQIKLVKHIKNQGYGAAILTGLRHAKGEIIVTMDSDGQHKPEEIPNLISPILSKKADFIVGSRYLGNCNYKVPFSTRLGEFCINKCLWLLFHQKIGNNQSGFRAFNKRTLRLFLNIRHDKFGLCTETLFKAAYNKLKIAEIPIHVDSRKYGHSKIRLFKLFTSILIYILVYSLRRFNIGNFWIKRFPNKIMEGLQNSAKTLILNDSLNFKESISVNRPIVLNKPASINKPAIITTAVPKISIIFPSYNGEKYLVQNLNSIKNLNNSENIELIIVDNNSKDLSIEIIESYKNSLNINLIKEESNLGFSKACNIGVANAKSEFIFITNQDVAFPPDFFQKLIPIYYNYNHKHEILISPALVFEGPRKEIDYFGAKNHVLGFSYTAEHKDPLPTESIVKLTQRGSGGTLFMRKKLFLDMGGFDNSLFMYYEDTDFSMRLLRQNIKIYTTNDPYLIHLKKKKIMSDFRYYLLERNRYITFAKNIDNFKKLLPYFILSEIMLIFQSIISKKFKLRVRIYYELFSRIKSLKIIRENSKKEANLLSLQNLSNVLDSVLIENSRNNKMFKKFLDLFNFVLKRI